MTISPAAFEAGARAVEVVLDIRRVHKSFKGRKRALPALRDVSLQVRRGRITGLIGPDGAGKTTLLRLAVGLLAPDAGQVLVMGRDATRDSLEVQSVLSYMPQRFGLYEDLTVMENLELYADLQGVPRSRRPDRYEELLPMTGLAPFTRRLAGRLSGGMKQKLGLACTLMRTPDLLLLDEPTVGVDPLSRRELWTIIDRLVREAGVSVFVSTLYLDEAEHCHEVVILHEGEVLGQEAPRFFSERMRGRTWTVDAPGRKPRALQALLARSESVVDAVVQGERVRLITEAESSTVPEQLVARLEGAALTPAEPRFEDAFIDMLRARLPRAIPAREAPGPSTASIDRADDRPVIEVEDVQRRFGDFYAVKGVTFQVDRGEVFGLLGANGAGKSTTFRMLCGLLPPSSGRLQVAGVDVRRAAADARARLGYMSQRFSLYGYLSVRQNLNFFSSAYGLSGRGRAARIGWALEQFQLAPFADSASADLPLGYKQRLALACALMHEPEILFLDEPTSGVDPLARREFWQRINDLAEQGVTVLVTTHFMEEAEYCDRLAVMAAGEILALGTPAEIKRMAGSTQERPLAMEDAFIHLVERNAGGGATS